MRNSVLAFLVVLIGCTASLAQQRVVERTFTLDPDGKVELELKFGEVISVKAWDKKEVSFRAVIEINGGRLNDALVLDYDERDGRLTITADYDKYRIQEGRRGDCPDGHYSTMSWNRKDGEYAVCSDIIYEVYIPRDAGLKVESISSDIELTGLQGPIHAKTISGFVDLSWPEQRGAELSMKTVSGEVYSGLDNLNLLNKKGAAPLVGYELRGSIGRGGPIVKLESISGNIYLRKGSS